MEAVEFGRSDKGWPSLSDKIFSSDQCDTDIMLKSFSIVCKLEDQWSIWSDQTKNVRVWDIFFEKYD